MGMLIMDYTRKVLHPIVAASAIGLGSTDIYSMGSAMTFDFCPGGPVEVVRLGVISQTTTFMQTATSVFTVRGDLHSRVSATGYTVTTGAMVITSESSAELGQPGNGVYVNASASPIKMLAGDKMTFALTTNGFATAGASGTLFIEYRDMPWQGHGRPTTVPGDGAGAGDIANMTNVTP